MLITRTGLNFIKQYLFQPLKNWINVVSVTLKSLNKFLKTLQHISDNI